MYVLHTEKSQLILQWNQTKWTDGLCHQQVF